MASGAWLAGTTAVILCQNSGLGNMVNPLTSLNKPFAIPVLLLVTWRGRPGEKDEPQHELMGEITPDLLTLLGIDWALLLEDPLALNALLDKAFHTIATEQKSFALIIAKNSLSSTDDNLIADGPNNVLPTAAAMIALELARRQIFFLKGLLLIKHIKLLLQRWSKF